jgi:hypothetical protein
MKPFGPDSEPGEPDATGRRCTAALGTWSSTATWERSVAANQHGLAMLSALLLLLLTLTLGSATLLYTLLDAKSTQHYKTGNQAFAAAEAGVLDVVNTVDTIRVVNFQNDVVNSGIISTALKSITGFSGVSYQVTSLVSGANPATDGILTVKGKAQVSAERVLIIGLKRGELVGFPGALHLSNDTAAGSFAGNSMFIDGNNWTVTDLANNVSTVDNSLCLPAGSCPRPAISTRNDTVTAQVIAALAGLGTITGLGSDPSVYTTAAASTADLLRFVNDILTANGAPAGCSGHTGNNDFWVPGGNGPTGVHCVPLTKGNQGNHTTPDFWGTLSVPNITYVTDQTARLAGGSSGAGILIFDGDVNFQGGFTYCGWVLFKNPSANGVTIGGNPTIYGEVWTPLPAFTGGGSITVKYSQDCMNKADNAGGNPGGNVPRPIVITSWAD